MVGAQAEGVGRTKQPVNFSPVQTACEVLTKISTACSTLPWQIHSLACNSRFSNASEAKSPEQWLSAKSWAFPNIEHDGSVITMCSNILRPQGLCSCSRCRSKELYFHGCSSKMGCSEHTRLLLADVFIAYRQGHYRCDVVFEVINYLDEFGKCTDRSVAYPTKPSKTINT